MSNFAACLSWMMVFKCILFVKKGYARIDVPVHLCMQHSSVQKNASSSSQFQTIMMQHCIVQHCGLIVVFIRHHPRIYAHMVLIIYYADINCQSPHLSTLLLTTSIISHTDHNCSSAVCNAIPCPESLMIIAADHDPPPSPARSACMQWAWPLTPLLAKQTAWAKARPR